MRLQLDSMRLLPLLLAVCTILGDAIDSHAQVRRFPLDRGWKLEGPRLAEPIPALVPGAVHEDLRRQGIIPEPYLNDQYLRQVWIDSAVWTYTLDLEIPKDWEGSDIVELVFQGLDTYAEVWLDGDKVLEADNMFRLWRIPIPKTAIGRSLPLRVVFKPAILEGAERAKAYGLTFPADSDGYSGKPSVFSRKAPYQFGWDFAPPMPGCGIWMPVHLEGWRSVRLEAPWLQTISIRDGQADLALHARVWSLRGGQAVLGWRMEGSSGEKTVQLTKGANDIRIPVEVKDPLLWWPSGAGYPHRYGISLAIMADGGHDSLFFEAGVRTIALDRAVDSLGTAFTFVVNGKPLFMKGANWVPADMFPGRVSDERYRQLLGMASDAGMNMLRIWGGGIYERELFYTLADSLGILVWQDFMFAGTMYPGDERFLSSVEEEATFQVRRLRRHPCIALWCGNNEIAVAWKNWGWQGTYGYGPEETDTLEKAYRLLFKDLLPSVVNREMPGAAWLESSPVSNWGRREDLDHGNNHFWGAWHGEMHLDSLVTRVPRFASEYGMPSYPTWESVRQCISEEYLGMDSAPITLRQRSYKGNGLLFKYFDMEGLPRPNGLQEFVERTHQVQEMALERAIRAHLADRPRCMGTLLWQFNEPWPGCSWAIIDHYGRPKPAYGLVRDLYREGPW